MKTKEIVDSMFNNFKKFLNLIRQHLISIIVVLILLGVIASTIYYFSQKIEVIQQQSENLVAYNQQMGELYIHFQEKILARTLVNERRDIFMIYSMNIIIRHYIEKNSSRYRKMTSNEIITFLDEIYINSQNTGINPFIPLAFACVETDFYNDAVGLDGERSMFQFMNSTVRGVYWKLHLPYLDDWWKDPKECVRVWFAYYHELSNNFIHEDPEQTIRWTALAYNVGLYRNRLLYNFNAGNDIDYYISTIYRSKGNSSYSRKVYEKYLEYSTGFDS
jgi:type II secretory pathway pseudopilin PulG